MDARHFSILFDNPRMYLNQQLRINNKLVVSDIDTIINVNVHRRLFLAYLLLLLAQYLLFFASLPMAPIENRPIMATLSSILLIFAFMFHSVTLPDCSWLIPSKTSKNLLLTHCVTQTLTFTHTLIAGTAIFSTKNHMLQKDDSGEIDITIYLKVIWLLTLTYCALALLLVATITLMVRRVIMRIEHFRNRLLKRRDSSSQLSLLSHDLADQENFFIR